MSGALAMLLGAALVPTVALPANITATHSVSSPSSASASITIKRDGTWTATGGGSGTWVTPNHATIGDDYDVKFDYTSGSPDVAAAADNTYVQLNANRTWTENQSGTGTDLTSGRIYIRRHSVDPSLSDCAASIEAAVDT